VLAVRATIRRLPARQGTVLVLRYHQDLPEREVARVLGIPVGTVNSTISRAPARLRGDLARGAARRRGELRPAAAASASSGYRAVTAVVPAT
jgi:DNA-directed RNA polymerase specialized sigma24 family protein